MVADRTRLIFTALYKSKSKTFVFGPNQQERQAFLTENKDTCHKYSPAEDDVIFIQSIDPVASGSTIREIPDNEKIIINIKSVISEIHKTEKSNN